MVAPTYVPRTPANARHERLTAWQACDTLALALYKETFGWRDDGLTDLADDIRQSVTAAVTRIVIGSAAGEDREFRRQLSIALGKLARLGCLWLIARDAHAVSPERWGELEASRDHAEQLTRGLYLALRKGNA